MFPSIVETGRNRNNPHGGPAGQFVLSSSETFLMTDVEDAVLFVAGYDICRTAVRRLELTRKAEGFSVMCHPR